MTDIEAKALALVREVLAERNLSDKLAVRREVSPYTEALCRAIEKHEAYKQEVSDALEQAQIKDWDAHPILWCFLIPKPKPDPLVEAFDAVWPGIDRTMVKAIRAALEARGLEIREKGQ